MKKYCFFALIFLLCACGNNKNVAEYFEKKIYIFAQDKIFSVDPLYANNFVEKTVAKNIFLSLYEIGEDLQVYQSFVESESFDTIKKVYSFNVKKNFFFSDDPCFLDGKGREVEAKDAVYSILRLLQSDAGLPFKDYFADENGIYVENEVFRVSGKYTFDVHLQKNFPEIKEFFSLLPAAIVPKEATAFYGEKFGQNPVASAAFVWKKDENEVYCLKKNPHYPQTDSERNKLPYLDKIYFESYSEADWKEKIKKYKNFVFLGEISADSTDVFTGLKSNETDIFEAFYCCFFPDSAAAFTLGEKFAFHRTFTALPLSGFQKLQTLVPSEIPRRSVKEIHFLPSEGSFSDEKRTFTADKQFEKYFSTSRTVKIFPSVEFFLNDSRTQRSLFDAGVLQGGVLFFQGDFCSEKMWLKALLPNIYRAETAVYLEKNDFYTLQNRVKLQAYLFPFALARQKYWFSPDIKDLYLHRHRFFRFEQVSVSAPKRENSTNH
jgi:hypothetical protein